MEFAAWDDPSSRQGRTREPAGPPDTSARERDPSAVATTASAFAAPDGLSWRRVSGALTWYYRMALLGAALPVIGLAGVLAWNWLGGVGLAVWGGVVGGLGVLAWFLGTWMRRSWGYAEGESDLHTIHGVAVRRVTAVPYGRVQLVTVTADLLERALGIATVRLYTAAAMEGARLPGVPFRDAVRLRDRIALRSETFSSGL